MSKKGEIKQALANLKINEALKLKGGSVVMTPPPPFTTQDKSSFADGKYIMDQNESSGENLTQVESRVRNHGEKIAKKGIQDSNLSWVQKNPEDRNSIEDENLSRVVKRSVDEAISRDQEHSLDQAETEDEIQSSAQFRSPVGTIPRSTVPRRATEQDDAVVLTRQVSPALRKGFTRISNELLMDLIQGELSKGEIKLLLLIARFTTSFGKEFAPLSKTVIERYTHLQSKSILESLAGLEDKRMIQKLKGNERTPNQLALAKRFAIAGGSDRSGNPSGLPDKKPPGVPEPPTDKFSTDYKDNFKNINKNTLSQRNAEIQNYFENLKPQGKRDEEFRKFQEIGTDFSEDQIALCLRFLQKNGSLREGERCHSPMAYLSKAMPEVLAKANLENEKHVKRLAFEHAQRVERQREEENLRRDEAERTLRDEAFQRAFATPEAQSEFFSKFSKEHPTFGPESRVLRQMAMASWWASAKQEGAQV